MLKTVHVLHHVINSFFTSALQQSVLEEDAHFGK